MSPEINIHAEMIRNYKTISHIQHNIHQCNEPVINPFSLSAGSSLLSKYRKNLLSPTVSVVLHANRNVRDRAPVTPIIMDDAVLHGNEGFSGAVVIVGVVLARRGSDCVGAMTSGRELR